MSKKQALKELTEKLSTSNRLGMDKVDGLSIGAVRTAIDAIDKLDKIEWLVDHMECEKP